MANRSATNVHCDGLNTDIIKRRSLSKPILRKQYILSTEKLPFFFGETEWASPRGVTLPTMQKLY